MKIRKNIKTILGACLGECIHVQGILNFFTVAQAMGYITTFISPSIKPPGLLATIKASDAEIIAVSYRLTPSVGKQVIDDFIASIRREGLDNRRYFLGCLPELAAYAKEQLFFDYIFVGGESVDEILPALREENETNQKSKDESQIYPDDLLRRIEWKQPFPVLRAHFGLPSLDETLKGIEALSNAKILDIISIAPDQTSQQYLHNPQEINTANSGAGGVPIRSSEHLAQIFAASRRGNFPLLRIYSGTQDLQKNAELFESTIHNAWPAIPIFWYSELDGRGSSKLVDAIAEHLEVIKWYAANDKPVEINDPHQWGLRMAPDTIVVADAFLAAKVAKKLGVKTFIQQLMFNTPLGVGLKQDLARVLAMIDITAPLEDTDFRIIRETRAGLAYFSPNETVAKGQLATSTAIQLAVKPEIIHIVSYCEATHAATPADIIESCTLVRKVIEDGRNVFTALLNDPEIQTRKNQLLQESQKIVMAFEHMGVRNFGRKFWQNPEFLADIVKTGLFDAPQLVGSKVALGKIKTKIIDGACMAVDENERPITESDRIKEFLKTLGINTNRADEISAENQEATS